MEYIDLPQTKRWRKILAHQSARIIPVIRIISDEVVFLSGEETWNADIALGKFLSGKDLHTKGQRIHLAGRNTLCIKWQGSSIQTATKLFDTLAEFSTSYGIGFIINYSCIVPDPNNEKEAILIFHPEIILKGNRLINDFNDIDLNRKYRVLENFSVRDITYGDNDECKVCSLVQAKKTVCEKTLASLDLYFDIDFKSSVVVGSIKCEWTGLRDDVRKKIIKRF